MPLVLIEAEVAKTNSNPEDFSINGAEIKNECDCDKSEDEMIRVINQSRPEKQPSQSKTKIRLGLTVSLGFLGGSFMILHWLGIL